MASQREAHRDGHLLSAHDVTKSFGGVRALERVSIGLPPATIVGVIGPNGAGKSTLFNCISGRIPMTSGTVVLSGRDVTKLSAVARARAGIGRTFQHLELFGSMTVKDNLRVAAEVHGDPASLVADLLGRGHRHDRSDRHVDEALALMGLESVQDRIVEELPVGTARLVELARALCAEPRLLLLDEPSAGLDRSETDDLARALTRVVRERDIAILLVEHDMTLVMEVCSYLYVLDFGTLIAEGTPVEVRNDPVVQAAYLGEEIASDDELDVREATTSESST